MGKWEGVFKNNPVYFSKHFLSSHVLEYSISGFFIGFVSVSEVERWLVLVDNPTCATGRSVALMGCFFLQAVSCCYHVSSYIKLEPSLRFLLP